MTVLFPELRTERLTLRALEPDDAAVLAAAMTPAVARWLRSWPYPMSREQAAARIAGSRAATAAGLGADFALVRRADRRLVGMFGGALAAGPPSTIALSYWLAEDCHGAGLMGEASAAAIPGLWELLPTAQVMEAGAQLGNEASFRIMRTLGMAPDGARWVHSPTRGRRERVMFFRLRRPIRPPASP